LGWGWSELLTLLVLLSTLTDPLDLWIAMGLVHGSRRGRGDKAGERRRGCRARQSQAEQGSVRQRRAESGRVRQRQAERGRAALTAATCTGSASMSPGDMGDVDTASSTSNESSVCARVCEGQTTLCTTRVARQAQEGWHHMPLCVTPLWELPRAGTHKGHLHISQPLHCGTTSMHTMPTLLKLCA
jgi:hypothetical protein